VLGFHENPSNEAAQALMALITHYYTNRIKTASEKLSSSEGKMASAAQEMLTSIRVVQTYGQGSYERSLFAAQSQKAMNLAPDVKSLVLEPAGQKAQKFDVEYVLTLIWNTILLAFDKLKSNKVKVQIPSKTKPKKKDVERYLKRGIEYSKKGMVKKAIEEYKEAKEEKKVK
jgi:ABC-type multidrug transport system fused ATPase/permease subunit